MALPIFQTFRSTVQPWVTRNWFSPIRLLVDYNTGSPVGIESPNANGPHGIWTPTDLTLAQIEAPSAAMLADLNATYRLNIAPYTRYQSTGTALVPIAGTSAVDGTTYEGAVMQTVPSNSPLLTVGVDSYLNVYSPWTIQNAPGVSVQGSVYVTTRPA